MKNLFSGNLRFYFITDDQAPGLTPLEQAEIAVAAGATMLQYRNKSFKTADLEEAEAVRDLCRRHFVPFIINDDILLARAVEADGVHVGQSDAGPAEARKVMGPGAVIGASVSNLEELESTDLEPCDYIGTGPVYPTGTKKDAKDVIGLEGLRAVAEASPVPVVAIGGVGPENVKDCMENGASGGAVISCITRSRDPEQAASSMGRASGALPRRLVPAWRDEFALIDSFLSGFIQDCTAVRIPPGDDAALAGRLMNPVLTTDTQRENVHFRLGWQSMKDIGRKAVEITFSDLAASYAAPQALLVNLGVPLCMSEESIRELYHGIGGTLKKHGAGLAGGNVSAARELVLDLFAVGEGRPDIFPLRKNARPGDGVYATGPLGLSRAGLICLKAGDPDFPSLVERFKLPEARFNAAQILADHGVSCVMDISDGLAGDAAHIAEASGVTIAFEPRGLPADEELSRFCGKYGLSAQELMFAGGEDYELLFACRPEVFSEIRQHIPEAFQVGACIPPENGSLKNLPPGAASYQHGS